MFETQPNPSPIGVFDSGVGGLSILKAIRTRLPKESLLYIADSANAPYGDREPAFILERAFRLTEFLIAARAKAVVIACNTATVVAAQALREAFDIPIIAVEPAIKPAVAISRSAVVAVLATTRTLESASVAKLQHHYGGGAELMFQACPGLVEQIERGEFASAKTIELLESYLQPVLAAGADTLVLGCTHYPFLAPQIQAIAGANVTILDSAEAVARQVERKIIPNIDNQAAKNVFLTTGDPERSRALISELWGHGVDVQRM